RSAAPTRVLGEVNWLNDLDNAVYAGESAFAKAKTAAKLFDEKNGTNFSATRIPNLQNEGQAEQLYLMLRSHLAPDLAHWESLISHRKQIQQNQQPVPSSAPAPQPSAAPAQAPAMEQTAYHVPIHDTGGART